MPRRRAFKLSLAAFVVLTGVWIASCRVRVLYSTGTIFGGIDAGALFGINTPMPAGFDCRVVRWDVTLQPEFSWIPLLSLAIPLWIPALLAGIPTFVLWRRHRRIPPGHCQACRYDLTGNTSGVCPECGTRTGDA